MPHWRGPGYRPTGTSTAANWEVVRTLVALALIIATLSLIVFAAAVLFDPYLNSRPVGLHPVASPLHWRDAPRYIPAGLR